MTDRYPEPTEVYATPDPMNVVQEKLELRIPEVWDKNYMNKPIDSGRTDNRNDEVPFVKSPIEGDERFNNFVLPELDVKKYNTIPLESIGRGEVDFDPRFIPLTTIEAEEEHRLARLNSDYGDLGKIPVEKLFQPRSE